MEFVKSSFCGSGSCVEAAYVRSSFCADRHCVEAAYVASSFCTSATCVEAAYVKSTHSLNNGTCVEAAPDGGRVLLRDGKDPAGTVHEFSRDEWYGFLDAIRAGDFADL